MFVPIACGSHCFKMAYDLARDCASKSLRPGFPKMRSAISLITHRTAIAALQHPALDSVNDRLSLQRIGVSGQNSLPRVIRMEIGRKTRITRVVTVISSAAKGFRPWGAVCPRAGRDWRSRPFTTRVAAPRGRTSDARRSRDRCRSRPGQSAGNDDHHRLGVALAFRSERGNGASAKA